MSKTVEMDGHHGLSPRRISRRRFLSGAAGVVSGQVVNPLIGEAAPTDIIIPEYKPEQVSSTGSGRPPGQEEDHGGEHHEEEHHGISTRNWQSALLPVGVFSGVIGGLVHSGLQQARDKAVAAEWEQEHGTAHPDMDGKKYYSLGPASTILPVAGAELGRLMMLWSSPDQADREWASHEASTIGINLGIAAGLVGASEVAARITLNPAEIEGLPFISRAESPAEVDPRTPAETASMDEWGEYAETMKHEFIESFAILNGTAMTLAPFATTYFSSSAANQLKDRVVNDYYAMSYAMERSSGSTHESATQKAVSRTDSMVNGKGGLNDHVLANACNFSGGLLFGDPPNFFYLTGSDTADDFVAASGWGLGLGQVMNAITSEAFLVKTLGFDTSHPLEAGLETAQDTGTYLSRLFQGSWKAGEAVITTIRKQIPGQRGMLIAENMERVSRAMKELQGDMQDKSKVNTLRRAALGLLKWEARPLGFNRGTPHDEHVPHAQGHEEVTPEAEMPERAMQELFRQLEGMAASSPGPTQEMVGQVIKKARDIYAATRSQSIQEAVMGVASLHKDAPLPDSIANILSRIQVEEPGREMQAKILESLTMPSQEGKPHPFVELLGQYAENTISSNDFLRAFERKDPTSHLHEATYLKFPFHTFTGSAEEVALALSTQIPAVEALVVLVEKGLEAVEALFPISMELKTLFVTILTAAISSVADNVAAFLFGKKVLLNMYQEEYPDLAENHPDLHNWITRSALYAAVAGGSGTILGNGPNFAQESIEISAPEEGTRPVIKRSKPVLGPDNILRPLPVANIAMTIGFTNYMIGTARADAEMLAPAA